MSDEPDAVQLRNRIADLEERNRRLKAELAPRAKGQWEAAFTALADAVCLVDADAAIVQCNGKMAELCGKPEQDLIGRKCCEVVHGASVPIEGCPLERMRKTLRRESAEMAFGDGWIRVAVDPMLDSDGQLWGAVHVVADITERKQVELGLEYRARFERLVTGISSRFVDADVDDVDDEIERALAEIGEFEEVGRAYVFQLHDGGEKATNTHEWCANGVEPQIHNLRGIELREETPWFEERLKKREVFHVPSVADLPPEASEERAHFEAQDIQSLIVLPIVCSQELLGFLGFDAVRDQRTWSEDTVALLRVVGEVIGNALARRRAEEQLQHRIEIEELISSVSRRFVDLPQDQLHRGIAYALEAIGRSAGVDRTYVFQHRKSGTRMDNSHEWCAEGVEPQMGRLQDLPTEAFPWFSGLIHRQEPVHVPRVADLPPEARAEKEEWQAESIQSLLCVSMLCHEKLLGFVGFDSVREEKVWSEADIRLLRVVGEIVGNAIRHWEAAEALRQTEVQLQQSQKMEAIGQLAGGIAHDFNNILQGIVGYTHFAHKAVDDQAVRRDLTEVRRLSDRGAGLVRQLLAFSRRQRLEREVLDLNVLAKGFGSMVTRLIGEHIDVELDLDDAPPLVFADRGQVEQVLMNLANNARNAMPDGGKLTIGTADVVLDERHRREYPFLTPGQYVELSVADTGSGMDKDTLAHLFEPFFSTKEVGQGTGLGLATVYGIVKQHDGHIIAESEMGKGSTFRIYLPQTGRVTGELVEPPPAEPSRPGTETILIVEDEQSVRDIATRILGDLGYAVLCAENADEAERVFAEHEGDVDLLLTDVVMPGRSGYQLYGQLLSQQPSLKVLFMSGYDEQSVTVRDVKASGMPFVKKPADVHELARKVRETLDN